MPARVLFTKELHNFLIQNGYTHIHLRGIEAKHVKKKSSANEDDYVLVPRKEGIGLFEDADLRIEPIDSTDISDMLDVEFGISFWVELPEEEAAAYKNFTAP